MELNMGRRKDENNRDSTAVDQLPLTISSISETPESSSNINSYSAMSNSSLSAFICRDLLRIIFEKLPISDLARAACVCRLWYSIASDKDILTATFKAPWKLKDIIGNPTSGSFWRDNSLCKFAISHRIVNGDTVLGLAVKYAVQVIDIKRLNNMMSDHGIYSRERLLIPLSNPSLLVGATCYIEMDIFAKREVAVLYLDAGPDKKLGSYIDRVALDQGKKRIVESLRRSMQVDDGTALYYLSISDGDPRAALTEFSQDLCWERHTHLA